MSPPICLIERTAQGDLIERVRVVAERLDEVWTASEGQPAIDRAASSARWVAEQVANHAERVLALVCLDTSGAFASWIRPTTQDLRVTESVIRQSEGEILVGVGPDLSASMDDSPQHALVGPDIATPGGGSFTIVPGVGDDGAARAQVLALRDASARIFLDELDALGVRVQGVCSIWHLAAMAWDPASPLVSPMASRAAEREALEGSSPTTAVCLLDPGGRLAWTWSVGGRVAASGSARVPTRDGRPRVREGVLARLASDWLAWSTQIGSAPRRIVFIAPALASGDDVLDTSRVASAIARALPGASCDVAIVDDPLGETCRRVAGFRGDAISPADDPGRSLTRLVHRPGRVHRGMHRWVGVALLVLAALAGLSAKALFDYSRAARESARAFNTEQSRIYNELPGTEPASGMRAVLNLEGMIEQKRLAMEAGDGITPPRPIMLELDALLFALSVYPDLELKEVSLDSSILSKLVVSVPDTRTYEELKQSLASLASGLTLQTDSTTSRGGRIDVTFNLTWATREEGR